MKISTLSFIIMCGGLCLLLSNCAADEQMGLCTELGACPPDCKADDGSCDSGDNSSNDHSMEHNNTENP